MVRPTALLRTRERIFCNDIVPSVHTVLSGERSVDGILDGMEFEN